MATSSRSVVFRNVEVTSNGCKASRYHQEIAMRGTLFDMDVDASNKLVVTVGQVLPSLVFDLSYVDCPLEFLCIYSVFCSSRGRLSKCKSLLEIFCNRTREFFCYSIA